MGEKAIKNHIKTRVHTEAVSRYNENKPVTDYIKIKNVSL